MTLTGRMRAAAGVKWLCTQTTSGHAHFGVFFEVAAKESDVYITGIRTASHYRSNIYEATYRVLVREVGLQAARVCLRAGALHALCFHRAVQRAMCLLCVGEREGSTAQAAHAGTPRAAGS